MRTLTRIGHRALCRVRARWIRWQLRGLGAELHRVETECATAGASDAAANVLRLRAQNLAIRQARSTYLLQKLLRDARRYRAPRASLVYRKHERMPVRN